jgi:flagellar assembly factor FliW
MSLVSIEQNNQDHSMQINTRFGLQDIDPESVIHFPEGLPGFEDLKQFKLFHEEGAQTLFYMQSVDDAGVQLPLVDPDHFQVNYEITLTDEELTKLQLDDPNDATVLVTVSKSDDMDDGGLHANFMGPIVINTRTRTGLQKALNQVRGTVLIRAD